MVSLVASVNSVNITVVTLNYFGCFNIQNILKSGIDAGSL